MCMYYWGRERAFVHVLLVSCRGKVVCVPVLLVSCEGKGRVCRDSYKIFCSQGEIW